MTRPTTLPEPWRSLAERCGGVVALAARLGVDRRTIGKWAHREREPGFLVRREIARMAVRFGLPDPFGG